jgi:transposase-like protein
MKSHLSGHWRRHRTNAQERSTWVEHFERSGLSRGEFAQRHGLNVSTLDRWRAQASARAADPAAAPSWQEVSLGPLLGAPPWVAEVQRPDGVMVRLSAAGLPLLEPLLTPRPC